jgi:hypothetical protein
VYNSSASQSNALHKFLQRHAPLLQQLHCAGPAGKNESWRQARHQHHELQFVTAQRHSSSVVASC